MPFQSFAISGLGNASREGSERKTVRFLTALSLVFLSCCTISAQRKKSAAYSLGRTGRRKVFSKWRSSGGCRCRRGGRRTHHGGRKLSSVLGARYSGHFCTRRARPTLADSDDYHLTEPVILSASPKGQENAWHRVGFSLYL